MVSAKWLRRGRHARHADVVVALILQIEADRSKRGDEALFYLGRDQAVGGGDAVHLFYIGR